MLTCARGRGHACVSVYSGGCCALWKESFVHSDWPSRCFVPEVQVQCPWRCCYRNACAAIHVVSYAAVCPKLRASRTGECILIGMLSFCMKVYMAHRRAAALPRPPPPARTPSAYLMLWLFAGRFIGHTWLHDWCLYDVHQLQVCPGDDEAPSECTPSFTSSTWACADCAD